MKKMILMALALTIFISCSSVQTVLEETRWYLLELEGNDQILSKEDAYPFIEFDGASSKAGGSSGCNNYFGQYICEGESLEFGNLARTEIYCEDLVEQETLFFKALARVVSYRLEDNLLIMTEGGEDLLIFGLEKPEPLTGKTSL